MGNVSMTIHAVGSHHNQDNPHDLNKMFARFVDELKAAGHYVHHAHLHHGGAEDMLSETSPTRTGAFGVLSLAAAAGALSAFLLWPSYPGFTGPAYAADLPAVKAVPAQPAPYVSGDAFPGVYLGVNGGYGWNIGNAFDSFGPISIAALNTAPQGFVGGVQVGAGQRLGSIWYLGAEADLDIATLDGTSTSPGLVSSTSKNKLMGSVRARFGVIPVGHALLYATAGYGYGSGEFTVTDLTTNASASVKPTMSGFVWGGGVEVPFSGNWLGRVEYLQYDFGDATVATPAVTFSVKDRVDVVRAGLNYRF